MPLLCLCRFPCLPCAHFFSFCSDYNCRLSKMHALADICYYMVGVKSRLHLKTTRIDCVEACFTSPACASFLLEFTAHYKSVRQGENIIRALLGHLSSLQALHEY